MCYFGKDYAPTKDNSKVFTVFYVLFGLLVIFSIINDFALYVIQSAEARAIENLKKKGSSDSTKEPHALKIMSAVMLILICVFAGAIFFSLNEDWSFLDGFYYSFITTMVTIYDSDTTAYDDSALSP